jgi:DNA-binding NarL/FixJ family response regulator
MKILIADDSSLLRERIKSLLNRIDDNLEVFEAENGQEALHLIRKNIPDLTILDIRIPEMTGIEVLKKIRELKMEVKICILTNYDYPIYKKRCIEAGADYFLRKTEDFEEIETIVRDILLDKLQLKKKSLVI